LSGRVDGLGGVGGHYVWGRQLTGQGVLGLKPGVQATGSLLSAVPVMQDRTDGTGVMRILILSLRLGMLDIEQGLCATQTHI